MVKPLSETMDTHDSDSCDIVVPACVSSALQPAASSPDGTAHTRASAAALAHAGGYALLQRLFQYCLLHLYLFLHVALLGGGSKRGGR